MPRGLVLVIEDDEWVSSLLSGAIRDAGYDVIVCNTAQAGLDTACDREPDCIICDIDLPDNDGYWVARNVRTQPSRVSVTPFLFLSALDDQEARLEGFHVGADAYMTKPFRVDEVVAQVGALVQMAWRLRQRRNSLVSVPPSSTTETTAIQGDLSQMSIATVLTVLELERRTGVVEVISKKRKVQLDVASGFIVTGTIGGTSSDAITILRSILGWKVGRFSFVPQPDRPPSGNAQPIGHLLLEAVRLEDESVHNGEQPRSSKAAPSTRLSAPSMGGPPSRHADLGPPSSKAFAEPAKPIHAPRAPAAAAPAAHAHDEHEAADRKAYYDWADFGMDEPVAPPSASRAQAGPSSQEVVPESVYGDDAQLVEEPEQLTELSADSLDDVDESPASEYQLEEEDLDGAPAYRPNSGGAPRRPGVGPSAMNAGGPLRPNVGSTGPVRPGVMAPRLPGGPPPRLTPAARPAVSAGLPGPPPRQPIPTKTAGGLPGPPPRAPGAAARLPGPPPKQPLGPSRPSGEYTRPSFPGPAPAPRAPAPGVHSKSQPPPLPSPGTGAMPRSPTPPPRQATQTRPDLSDSGVRPAPPPLPPRHPQTGPVNDKKR